jgi:DNA-binding response OmpR family regulator
VHLLELPVSEPTPLAGKRILVVEDEYLVAITIEDMLDLEKAVVLGPYASIASALASLDGDLPDGALLDVNVKGASIIPLADELKKRGVPILLCTGYASNSIALEGLGEFQVLPKPFDYAIFRERTWRAFSAVPAEALTL